ncbi:MAG: Flp family type IVb pilin [Phycisphaeraceae bacterium]
MKRLHRDQQGQTALEWTLLLGVIAIPSYLIVRLGVATLIAHYQMVTTLNGLPFP